jgi:PAS domain S-box-containing protein
MKPKKPEQKKPELCKRAEENLRTQITPPGAMSDKEAGRLIHELQVHQIELEMQNEELRKSQAELEESRTKYSDLYDFAPVGYFTFDKHGLILEANLAAATQLGVERSRFINKPFRAYIVTEDREIFDTHLQEVFKGDARETCEVRLKKIDGSEIYVKLESIAANDFKGNPLCRTSVSDITESKKIENVLTFLSQCGAKPGEDFFQSLARYLAENLGMDYVCIDWLEGDSLTARTVVVYSDGKFEDNVSYNLHDTPCGEVVGKTVCCFPSGVRHLFTRDAVLQDMMAESYVGVTLWGHLGRPIGLIAVIGRKPLKNSKLAESILRLVAVRAADELERKQAEEVLRHSEEHFRLMTENALDIITILEADGAIRYESTSIKQVLGYKREDLIGKHYSEFIHPDDLPDVMKIFNQLIKEPGFILFLQARCRHKDGSWRILEIMGNNLIDNPAVKGIVFNSRDITKRKQAEEELKQLSDELKRSNKDLQQFASAASHDLQEPLRGIEGFIKLLEKRYKGKLDEKADEFIDYVLTDVNRMQMLIKDLLEYSRVSAKGKVVSPANCSVVLEQALSNLRAAIDKSGAVVTYDLLPTVMGDDAQLSRLFQNLVGNAIKFRSKEPLNIRISAHREGDEWIFSIRDNGIGIHPEQAERIFVIFQRLHSKQEYPGTGLGLALCKRIVERHGGRIWVESEHGKGSGFFFALPAL